MAEKQINLRFRVTDDGTVVLDKIGQSIQKVDSNVKTMSQSLTLIKWDAIVNLGQRAIGAAEQVYSFAKSIAEQTHSIEKQAEIMGLSIGNYQKLAYAARMADVDTEQFGTGMKFLSRAIEDAKSGTGTAGQYFRALGIDIENLSAGDLKLENMLYRVADAFKDLENGTAKTDIAVGLFGRSGQNMIQLFDKGSESIRAFGEEGQKAGRILSEDVVKSGSEANKTFKELGATFDATKLKLAPAALGFTQMLESILSVDIKASFAKMKKDFLDIFSGGEFFPVKEILSPIIAETQKELKKVIDPKMFADPEGIKRAKDLLTSFLEAYKPQLESLKELGVVSTEFYTNQINLSQVSFAAVKKAFSEGKISAVDYGNVLKNIMEMYKKFTGKDVTDQLLTLDQKTQDSIDKLDKNAEDFQKQYNRIVDESVKERNKILEQSPTYIRANLSKWESDLADAKREYDQFAASIQPVSISGAGGTSTGGAAQAAYSEVIATGQNYGVNFDFTGTGMSPKMSLGDAFKKLAENFGSVDDMIGSFQVNIDFATLGDQMKALQKQLDQINMIPAYMDRLVSTGLGLNVGHDYQNQLYQQMDEMKQDIQSKMSTIQMSMVLEMLKGYSTAGFFSGSFQFGTTYVPKTGLAVVHEGEKIVPKNVRYGDSNATFNISGNDPKKIADEIAKILKYRRSSNLRESINV